VAQGKRVQENWPLEKSLVKGQHTQLVLEQDNSPGSMVNINGEENLEIAVTSATKKQEVTSSPKMVGKKKNEAQKNLNGSRRKGGSFVLTPTGCTTKVRHLRLGG